MEVLLGTITLIAVAVTVAMTTWTVRLAREDRRRSNARVAMLEQEIAGAERRESGAQAAVSRSDDTQRRTVQPAGLLAGALPGGRDDSRLAMVVGIVLAVLVGVAGAGLLLGRGERASADTLVTGEADHRPLELTSLRHERDGTEWSIVGLVRNPADGTPIEAVTAVGFLFDDQGAFLSSGRAPLEFSALAPGSESPFTIRIATPHRVARYRVGFRTSDGGVIRHIDRRPARGSGGAAEPLEP